MKTNNCNSSTHAHRAGFSLVEIMVAVASISTLCGVGVVAARKAQEAGQRHKLDSDVATLNRSVRVYLGNGGQLPDEATPSEVLRRLKSRVTAESARTLVGQSGPFLDPRVTGVPAESGSSLRVVWNGKARRFEVDRTGDGFTSFALNDKAGVETQDVEVRSTAEKFAAKDSWVWDYQDAASAPNLAAPEDTAIAATVPTTYAPQNSSPGKPLQPPTISVPPGLYDYADFPMPVQLVNPNPPGSSVLWYSLNDGPWTTYTPDSNITLPKEQLNVELKTYAAPSNNEQWVDSASSENLYQTIFFRGATSGVFKSPVGDAGLVTNLKKLVSSHFEWGSPSIGFNEPNSLDFTGVGSFFALPEQEFKIGEIKYYNGTTFSGTNATSVQMTVTLDLQVPKSTELLNFTLKLQSTTNRGRDKNEDADYVWIPTLSSKFSTTVQGKTFYLQLRFGPADANSFTTIDEFHVHEGKRATGAIYGKLTTTPVL